MKTWDYGQNIPVNLLQANKHDDLCCNFFCFKYTQSPHNAVSTCAVSTQILAYVHQLVGDFREFWVTRFFLRTKNAHNAGNTQVLFVYIYRFTCQADFQTLPTDFHCQGNFLQQKIANGDLRLKMPMEIVPFFRCLSQLLRQAKSLEPKQWQRKAQGYTLGFFCSLMAFQVSFIISS